VTILLFFIFIGLSLLAILYWLISRPLATSPEGSAQSLQTAHGNLLRLQHSLLSTRTVEAIFSESDLNYVQQSCSPEILQLLLFERRRIALLWVSEIRAQIISLSRFHRAQSGFYSDLSFAAEFSLVRGFWTLLLACRGLQLLIYFRGPFAARAIAIRTIATAWRLCDLAGQPIAFLNTYSARLTTTRFPGAHAPK
jgi:hypothetical protein